MGGGIAFEALNHIGGTDEDLLVILNDNHIAIDERTGGMNRYLLILPLLITTIGLKYTLETAHAKKI